MKLPLFEKLENSRNVLVAGAGGGYDVFSGLPLYCWLRSQGVSVHLANLSFSRLSATNAEWVAPGLARVTADTSGPAAYFPEQYLLQWLREEGIDSELYCFERTGVRPVTDAYQALVERLGVDTILLVDGGTDSLMRGDEFSLATPQEDVASILGAHATSVPTKMLLCIGFGVDTYHGVCHHQFLEAVAALTKAGDFLGAWSLQKEMKEAQQYMDAVASVGRQMSHHPSIVCNSIISALQGHYGDHHATARTATSELWINPIMPMYWAFTLSGVVERLLYAEDVKESKDYRELTLAIERFRHRIDSRDWKGIPA